jgi:hypothetical protein
VFALRAQRIGINREQRHLLVEQALFAFEQLLRFRRTARVNQRVGQSGDDVGTIRACFSAAWKISTAAARTASDCWRR